MVLFLLKLTSLVTLISHSEAWMFSICFCDATLMVQQEPEDQVKVNMLLQVGLIRR